MCGERVNRLSQINQLANEIGLLAHVISKMKMAETLLSEMQEKSCLCPILVMKGEKMACKDCFKRLSIQSMELSECIVVFRIELT